ncbi:angiogenic factor with G patch and FHA domains 1-like [Anopheles ziemanni]|uniref:angiogenic factor with G patch and FHA domains 1-like n=1 Tax=Anopheles ziemanni TaxID=345580 RepID=UPI00265A583C|nr:angiogenic factor with G patch and FHA domains 1 isoform X1 [Anopheles coustani]XP_058124535.1 angiogenic factor with G patch and FHA domains 1 isoform X1 [Anopheles coustani]XP_058174256.1 angiogenic factor with G patch and FHA domains 1-like [Anopheles ziemanni]
MKKRSPQIKLFKITNLYDVTANQLCHYVQALHKHIRKQNARIERLKKKVKSLRSIRKQSYRSNGVETEQTSHQVQEETPSIEPLDIKAFVDDIKKTAQDVDIKNRYIFEPTSGLYYDPETGYYYNSIYGLHYDGHRGCYLKYNEDTKEYDFYSQVVPETMLETEPKAKQKKQKRTEPKDAKKSPDSEDSERAVRRHRKRSRKHKKRHRKTRHRSRSSSESDSSSSSSRRSRKRRKLKRRRRRASSVEVKEEGELESSDGSDSESIVVVKSSGAESEDSAEHFNTNYKDVAKRYPPSLRIIVKETNVKDLKIGSLFIVTCKGGSLGREGNHDVIIPDINVSKKHLQFEYNAKKGTYQFVDLGSRNGTLYNGMRVKIEDKLAQSEPQTLVHGSVLQLNQTKLLCHVHEGNSTCGKCEPGLLVTAEVPEPVENVSKITKPVSHKEGLKLIQKRFGLENEKYVGSGEAGNNAPDYQDRAAYRRKVKGSSNEHEKTQVASLDQSISSNNKGFQMLSKLGWNEGKSLGKNDDGLTEPIPLKSNVGTSGLGSLQQVAIGSANANPVDPRRHTIWRKTQERFKQSTVFKAESSDESE